MATNDSGSGGKRREVEEERMEKSVRKDRVRDRESLPLNRSINAILSLSAFRDKRVGCFS